VKRKKKKEEHVDEAWLLPYSDMLTLLLALFIVMFATAKVDDKKFEEIKNEFGSLLSSHAGQSQSVLAPFVDMKNTGTERKTSDKFEAQKSESALKASMETQQLKKISDTLNNELSKTSLKDTAQVELKNDGIHITLDGNILFRSGKAELSADMDQTLAILANTLKKLDKHPVVIAGHTDNVPQSGDARYPTNWELSSSRAISVMNYFISNRVFDPNDVSIQAYADTHPKKSNATSEGRQANRRVELLIQRNIEESPKNNS